MNLTDFTDHKWGIDRIIEDHLSKSTSKFEGTAEFHDGLYAEIGVLHLPTGQNLKSSRSYIWRETQDGISVFFEDGRLFHVIGTDSAPKAAHFCDPDQYDVTYDFSMWPKWTSTWNVIGPRKNYKMVSVFTLLVR